MSHGSQSGAKESRAQGSGAWMCLEALSLKLTLGRRYLSQKWLRSMARSAFLCVNCMLRSILQGHRARVIASTKEMGTCGPVCQEGAWTWQLPVALYGLAPHHRALSSLHTCLWTELWEGGHSGSLIYIPPSLGLLESFPFLAGYLEGVGCGECVWGKYSK